MKHLHSFARRAAAFLLAAVLCVCIPAAAASAATTIGGADTTLIPAEDENCLSWLFGSKDKITMPYLNIKGQGLKRNVTLDLEDCLVGITYTELGSIGSFVSASAAQQAWKAQAVAVHSYLEYHKQYGSSTNALIYTPVDQIPASARNAIRKAVQAVKDEVLVYNGSVCDAVWSASAGYNTQTGVYGTCASLDAWGTDVPYLQSVESPYEEQYHKVSDWLDAHARQRILFLELGVGRMTPALCSTTRWCPTGAATGISTSSSPPATASILAPMPAAPPA